MEGQMGQTSLQRCDGSFDTTGKGTWKGHVVPGVVFILWGSWWALNVMCAQLAATPHQPYRSRGWYSFPWGRRRWLRWLRYFEPLLKLLLPLLAVSVELFWDHDEYRYLYCPEGSMFAGRFAEDHVNNWQHAASYPAFVLAGGVDLLALALPLPAGTSQAFLTLAFSAMAFLMGTHSKHEPLDATVHWLLCVSMLLCVALLALELVLPHRPLLGAGRAAATIFQGAWLVQVAKIQFETHPQWSGDYMASVMLAPVAFVAVGVTVAASLLGLYAALAALKEVGLLHRLLPLGGPRLRPSHQLVAGEDEPAFKCDSAQNSMDGSPRGKTLTPFQIGPDV